MSAPFVNSDMGEGLGLHSFGNDDALLDVIAVANMACGFHASDPAIMDQTVAKAVTAGVKVGAHPGLPDLMGFGRRRMALEASEVEQIILYQVGALTAFLRKHDAPLHHIKPHGSLYGMLAGDDELMRAAAGVCALYGVPFFGMAGTAHERVCAELGVSFVAELYVDLDYNAEGGLIILRRPAAADPAAAAARVQQALDTGAITTADGTQLPIRFDSVCVHSDSTTSPQVALAVRQVLDAHVAHA